MKLRSDSTYTHSVVVRILHQQRTPVLISHEVDMYRSVMICINQLIVTVNHEVALYQSVTRQICTDQS